jgi:SAM-dependent methyltransferase
VAQNDTTYSIDRKDKMMEMAPDQFKDFDEEAYLAANPDVLDAVVAGTMPSGLEHYLGWGRHEGRARPVVKPAPVERPAYRPLDAMPPEALRLRVSGVASVASFEQVGRSVSHDILDAMATHQIALAPDARVLDFGCGCGRVFRHFAPQCPGRIDGVDIDAEAIGWCQANLAAASTFHHSSEWPPLPFEDARFDLIYSVSVFTHLPETMQLAWLTELRRVAKPGAWLLLSVHAPNLMPTDVPEAADRMAEFGFAYVKGAVTDGLPDFYRTAFHAEAYIRREWGKLFQIDAVLTQGINRHQDLVVAHVPGTVTDDVRRASLGRSRMINATSRNERTTFDVLVNLRRLFRRTSG